VQVVEQILFGLTVALYFASAVMLGIGVAYRRPPVERVSFIVLAAGLVLNTGAIILRGILSSRVPLADFPESLLFLAWCTVLLFLLLNLRYRVAAAGLILVPVAFFLVAVAAVLYEAPRPLREQLRGVWLATHVGVSLLAYAGFAVAFATAFFYVVQEDLIKKRYSEVRRLILALVIALGTGIGLYVGYLVARPTLFEDATGHRVYAYSYSDLIVIAIGALAGFGISLVIGLVAAKGASRPSFSNRLPALYLLDDLSYRCIIFGFGLLALGIITGSIWSHFAWGSWWIWDPKETWALAAWLFYAAYLGLRNFFNWRGRNAAALAIAGLFLILFAFLGVKFLVPGKHDFN
jgi:cytochrome c-type biogenesis protein CcsB